MSASSSVVERRQLGSIFRSVVKVIAVSDPPDYDQPWQTRGTTNSVGSGAIVETPGIRFLRITVQSVRYDHDQHNL